MNDYGVIYLSTNLVNGKKYVGQTTQDFSRRKQRHNRDAYKGSQLAFHRAIRKYGKDNFDWIIIDTASNQEELDDKETQWICSHNTLIDSGMGYNLTLGVGRGKYSEELRKRFSEMYSGEGNPMFGKNHTEETKKLLSESRIGRFTGEENPFFGKTHSEEVKTKISRQGTKHSEESKLKMSMAHKGENHHYYGKKRPEMTGEKNPFFGRTHSEEARKLMSERQKGGLSSRARAVVQLTLDGDYVATYETAKEGSQAVGGQSTNVTRCCRGKASYCKGFKWMYADEYKKLEKKEILTL